MSAIWLNDEHVIIKSYAATVKGAKATVRIELDVSDPGTLGFLLEELCRAQVEQRRKAKAPATKRAPKPERRAVTHQPTLRLPYYGDEP